MSLSRLQSCAVCSEVIAKDADKVAVSMEVQETALAILGCNAQKDQALNALGDPSAGFTQSCPQAVE